MAVQQAAAGDIFNGVLFCVVFSRVVFWVGSKILLCQFLKNFLPPFHVESYFMDKDFCFTHSDLSILMKDLILNTNLSDKWIGINQDSAYIT